MRPPDAAPASPRTRPRHVVLAMLAVVALAVAGAAAGLGLWLRTRPRPLCPAVASTLAALPVDVHVRAFVTRRGKHFRKTSRALEQTLAAMKQESSGRLDYDVVDAATPEGEKAAHDAGLVRSFASPEEGQGGTDLSWGHLGLELRAGSVSDTVATLGFEPQPPALEVLVATAVRDVASRAVAASGRRKRIGVLVGHGAVSLDDPHLVPRIRTSMRDVLAPHVSHVELVDVDLSADHADVPADLDGLVVLHPTAEIPERELRRIDAFVMRGKRLGILASAAAFAAGDASMRVELAAHGVERLAAGYGLELGRAILVDDARAFRTKVQTPSGPRDLAWPHAVVLQEEDLDGASSLFMARAVAFPLASPITLHPERQPGAVLRALARTGASTSQDTRTSFEVSPFAAPTRPEGPTGSAVVAATASGTLTSAFGGARSAGPARVVLLASSLLVVNPFVRAGSGEGAGQMGFALGDESLLAVAAPYAEAHLTSAALLLKATLTWLAYADDLDGCLAPLPSP